MLVKVGIIGLGHMGGYHGSICSTLNNVELTAIADPTIKNWSKIKSSKVIKTKSYKEWIDSVDAVIIAVPTEMHFDIAKECLLKNKHVLLEKPLTKTVEQAKELFKIAKENKVVLHVGHVERFNGAVQELKKIVQDPYLIECHRIGPFSNRPQKDSVVLDLMIHDLDIVLNLVNSPITSISSIGNKIETSKGDIAVVQIKFENGVLSNIVSSRVAQVKRRTMSVHQKDCFILLDFTTQDISIHSHITDSVKVGSKQLKYKQEGTVQRLFVYKDNPLKLEIENYIKAIRSAKRTLQPEQDMIALKLALEIEKIFTGETIKQDSLEKINAMTHIIRTSEPVVF